VAPPFFHDAITRLRHDSFLDLTLGQFLGRLHKLYKTKREDHSRPVAIKLFFTLALLTACQFTHHAPPNPYQLIVITEQLCQVVQKNITFAFSLDFWPPNVVVHRVVHETGLLEFCFHFLEIHMERGRSNFPG
jgi:hypothetical protein